MGSGSHHKFLWNVSQCLPLSFGSCLECKGMTKDRKRRPCEWTHVSDNRPERWTESHSKAPGFHIKTYSLPSPFFSVQSPQLSFVWSYYRLTTPWDSGNWSWLNAPGSLLEVLWGPCSAMNWTGSPHAKKWSVLWAISMKLNSPPNWILPYTEFFTDKGH